MTPQSKGIWSRLRLWTQSVRSRLGFKIATAVFCSILAVELMILIPSYFRYEEDLLARLEHAGRSIMLPGFRQQAHADDRDLLLLGRLLLKDTELTGGSIYRPDGALIGSFGEVPTITPSQRRSTLLTHDAERLEVVWHAVDTGIPFDLVARLDASWIAEKLDGFILRIAGLVLMISFVVCGTAMLFVGHLVLQPIVRLHRAVAAAEAQPDRPDRHIIEATGRDELQSVIRSFNRMIQKIAATLRDESEARDALEGMNQSLEARVVARTKDLQEINTRLEREVAERKQAEARVSHEALHDSTTGLANRRLLVDRIGRALTRSRRDPDVRFAVILINLSRFRILNEGLGHAAGDVLLTEVAGRLRMLVRDNDTLARMAGDEFCLVAEGIGSIEELAVLVKRVEQAFKSPFKVLGEEIVSGATAGVAFSDADSSRSEKLLQQAKIAMQRARDLGRFYTVFEEAMEIASPGTLRLESDLRRALDRPDSFELHYQPVMRLDSEELTGFEALVRWRPDEGKLVSPGTFIPLAEDTGLIVPLGRWVLNEGIRQLSSWRESLRLPDDFSVAINVSGRQLQGRRFVEEVEEALSRHRVPPASVKLEATESSLLKNPAEARTNLNALKELGVGLAIDDFGTGYSSLSYLRLFPFDILKIDQSFVRAMSDSVEGEGMVKAILEIAGLLNMATVAEGVETERDRDILRRLGCPLAQGYYYDPPLVKEQAEHRLREALDGPMEELLQAGLG